MKGSEAKLVSYMQGADKRFIIPLYQRNYDWRTDNCKQLYDDLIAIIRIKDETSWTQMAKFHAEWSKKFYDVFVPLLHQWNEPR